MTTTPTAPTWNPSYDELRAIVAANQLERAETLAPAPEPYPVAYDIFTRKRIVI